MCAAIAPGRFRPFKMKIQHASGDFWPALPFMHDPSISIFQRNDRIRRTVVSLHGMGGDAIQYYNRAVAAVALRPHLIYETLIVVPQFFKPSEVTGTIDRDVLYWAGGRAYGNYSGNDNLNPRTFFARSYHVMDRLLEHLTRKDLFPNLRIIVLIGHSNGGQFIARYASINTFEDRYAKDRGVHVRYVPMNPGSYLYFTDKRWEFTSNSYQTTAATNNSWINDVVQTSNPGNGCSRYNHWPTGLVDLSGSRADYQSHDEIMDKFVNRDVGYMVGGNDISCGGSTDCGFPDCETLRQGDTHLAVGLLNYYGLQDVYGSEITERQRLVVVPGVRHNGAGMMSSSEGLEEIFRPAPPPEPEVTMTTLADYFVVRDTPVTLRAGQHESFTFDVPADKVRSGGSKRPIVAFYADPSGDARNLSCVIQLNGRAVFSYPYTGGTGREHFEVVNHEDLIPDTLNSIRLSVQSGEGSVKISDIILWFQRNV